MPLDASRTREKLVDEAARAFAANGVYGRRVSDLVKTAMGWNFVAADRGREIMADVVQLVLNGTVRPFVGQVVEFDAIPAAIEAMAIRETIGRTIVRLEV